MGSDTILMSNTKEGERKMKKMMREFILANLEYNRGRWPQAWRLERVRKELGLSKREVREIEDDIVRERQGAGR